MSLELGTARRELQYDHDVGRLQSEFSAKVLHVYIQFTVCLTTEHEQAASLGLDVEQAAEHARGRIHHAQALPRAGRPRRPLQRLAKGA